MERSTAGDRPAWQAGWAVMVAAVLVAAGACGPDGEDDPMTGGRDGDDHGMEGEDVDPGIGDDDDDDDDDDESGMGDDDGVAPSCVPFSPPGGCGSLSDCAAVLEEGLGVSVVRQENEDLMTREMARSYLCESSNAQYIYDRSRRESGGGGVSFLGFSISGGGEVFNSVSTVETWQEERCAEDVREASLDSLRQFFISVNDQRPSVYAWTQCVNAVTTCHAAAEPAPKGFMAQVIDGESDVIAIELRWCGTVGDVRVVDATVTAVDVIGLDCTEPLAEGEPLPVGETSVFCSRLDPNADGLFAVTAEVSLPGDRFRRYSAMSLIPAIDAPEPVPVAEERLYYFDPDGDGYAAADARMRWMAELPEDEVGLWTERVPGVWTDTDCCELDANTRPGQDQFFAEANYCGSYDYDCDGEETLRFEEPAICDPPVDCRLSSVESRVTDAGWVWGNTPPCGDQGLYGNEGDACGGFLVCIPEDPGLLTQTCR
ncbi:MAG TPA: hypothetical protein RMF84_02320 [Polyangiaceae bacterium LLY-WYZ-14_1]|nr:hypothetical protein [Polyangiaceae bacterium LLY-WYZ-14_1]